jgi:hypothetical protein
MTTPCEHQDKILEISRDVKTLLEFRNKALGVIIAVTSIFSMAGVVVSIIVTISRSR